MQYVWKPNVAGEIPARKRRVFVVGKSQLMRKQETCPLQNSNMALLEKSTIEFYDFLAKTASIEPQKMSQMM